MRLIIIGQILCWCNFSFADKAMYLDWESRFNILVNCVVKIIPEKVVILGRDNKKVFHTKHFIFIFLISPLLYKYTLVY